MRRAAASSGGRNDSPSRGSTYSTPSRNPAPLTSRTISQSSSAAASWSRSGPLPDVLDEPAALDVRELGRPDSAGERRPVPRVSVLERARACGDRLEDVLPAQDGADRHVAGAEALRVVNDVRLDRKLVGREPGAGAADPRD